MKRCIFFFLWNARGNCRPILYGGYKKNCKNETKNKNGGIPLKYI